MEFWIGPKICMDEKEKRKSFASAGNRTTIPQVVLLSYRFLQLW
jgi:hypothetical protein